MFDIGGIRQHICANLVFVLNIWFDILTRLASNATKQFLSSVCEVLKLLTNNLLPVSDDIGIPYIVHVPPQPAAMKVLHEALGLNLGC